MKLSLFLSILMCFILNPSISLHAQLPAPTLLTPVNNATKLGSNVKLYWQSVTGADQYKVAVGIAPSSNNLIFDTTYVGTSYQLNNLPNGTYMWRIKAKHTNGDYSASEWSTIWTFTVGTTGSGGSGGGGGLGIPIQTTPSNNAMMQVLGTNLQWQAVANATYYIVKIATDASMSNLIFTDNHVNATSRFAQNLNYNTIYYWTIQAANLTSLGPVSATRNFTTLNENVNAVKTHPRLLITPTDVSKLQSWATNSNPVWVALQTDLNIAINTYNNLFFPGGQANSNWPDNGGTTWSGYVTEQYAEFFAFMSLVDPVVANRPLHAKRARNLLMYVIDKASLGTSAGVPFRDPAFMTYDRSRVYGEACPLTVDWIYNAKDGMGNDILTSADKAKIRTVFMRWCNDQLSAYNHPTPIGISNDKQITLTNPWILNNYYSGHARNLTLMSMCIDEADDAAIDPNVDYSALGNSLRSYIFNATGAWLYQQYAQFEKPEIVSLDYNVSTIGLGRGSGGLSVESSLYGQSIGWVAQELLAMKTAGWADENIIGKQARLLTSDYWTRLMDGLLHIITPTAKVPASMSYLGPVYFAANYGDLLRTWIMPEMIDVSAAIGLIDIYFGNNQNRLDKARWFSRNALQGGNANLTQRITNIWSGSNATEGLYYFMLLEPGASSPADPRPNMNTVFWDPAFSKVLARTDWTNNESWFNWQCHWTTINHQSGDGNQFEFFRKGEWMIKERSGYTNDGVGYTSEFHNTLALQNDVPANLQWFEGPTSSRGGQWTNGANAGSPTVITSFANNFIYATGVSTNLYNRPNQSTPANAATDITHASRSIVWLNPDHIIVYDRATSKTANRFKRFFLQFTAIPSVSGKNVTVSTPGGQNVFLTNLLPAASVLTAFPTENINQTAQLETAIGELKIEDPSNPKDVRFLNVIQGANGSASKDIATLIQSTSGDYFEGVVVNNFSVMFPNVWGGNFTSTTYTVPMSVSLQIVTGLVPGAGYDVSSIANGNSVQMTITPGSSIFADAGGVLQISILSSNAKEIANLSSSSRNGIIELYQNNPNPFTENTVISYQLSESAPVTLTVYDPFGRVVALLSEQEMQSSGFHQKTFYAKDYMPGIYYYQIQAGNSRVTKRMLIE